MHEVQAGAEDCERVWNLGTWGTGCRQEEVSEAVWEVVTWFTGYRQEDLNDLGSGILG